MRRWLHRIFPPVATAHPREERSDLVEVAQRLETICCTRFERFAYEVARLRSRSCIIDGEAVCCDEGGFAQFIRLPPGTGARLN